MSLSGLSQIFVPVLLSNSFTCSLWFIKIHIHKNILSNITLRTRWNCLFYKFCNIYKVLLSCTMKSNPAFICPSLLCWCTNASVISHCSILQSIWIRFSLFLTSLLYAPELCHSLSLIHLPFNFSHFFYCKTTFSYVIFLLLEFVLLSGHVNLKILSVCLSVSPMTL